jgi:hypothetical protein
VAINEEFIREKWLPALRSGEYKQTRNFLSLKGDDGSQAYCCLGVACQLLVDEGIAKERQVLTSGAIQYTIPTPYTDDIHWVWNEGDLPVPIAKYLGVETGLDFNYPITVENPNDVSTIVTANDRLGKNFSEIADIIEAQLNDNNIQEYQGD